jgi:hypothetical protein
VRNDVRDELYDEILELLIDKIGYKCQVSELEELALDMINAIREVLTGELM